MKKLLRKMIALGVSKVPAGIITDAEFFELYQSKGWHVVPNHFYDPIPDTSLLPDSLWHSPSEMVGVDQNIEAQAEFLDSISESYLAEYHAITDQAPTSPVEYTRAASFAGIDGAILYSMIRKQKPKKIIEIGSGGSTLLSLLALRRNEEENPADKGEFVAIEPYPSGFVREALRGTGRLLVEDKVENVPTSEFETLGENDILFIDSSHTVKIGGDVLYEILEVIPRLKKGVLIHVHDIFLPYHYPKAWVKERLVFWTEQYLLHAFIAFNRDYEILWSGGCMRRSLPEKLSLHFPYFDHDHPHEGSFWMKRRQ